MTHTENAHRARAGAVSSKAGSLKTQHNEYTGNIQPVGDAIGDEVVYQPCVDECVYRLRRALRRGRFEPDSWGFNFTRSVLRHSKRAAWVASPKQLAAMRGLVAELAEPDTGPLVDDGGDDDCAT